MFSNKKSNKKNNLPVFRCFALSVFVLVCVVRTSLSLPLYGGGQTLVEPESAEILDLLAKQGILDDLLREALRKSTDMVKPRDSEALLIPAKKKSNIRKCFFHAVNCW